MATNVIPFPAARVKHPPAPANDDDGIPPFDPTNAAHQRAWRSLVEFGQRAQGGR